jgi:WD40-like Beta Propeller Repeat
VRIPAVLIAAVSVALLTTGGGVAGVGCFDCLGPGNEDPVWLPSGQGIAYAGTSKTNVRDVFIRHPDGTTVQLTHSAKILFEGQRRPFAFSPDGGTLAFVDDDLQVVQVATGTVTRHVAADFSPVAFSPDGSQVAFEHHGLWALDVTSGSTRLIAAVGHDPAWRGTAVAFDANGVVYLPDGPTAKAIAYGTRPVWSPDGKWIAYERKATVWAKRVDDQVEYRIGRGSSPRWMPGGTRLVYGGVFGELETADVAGGTSRILYNSEQIDREPVPSPDGSEIAFVADRDGEDGYSIGQGDIYLVPASGGKRIAVVGGCRIDALAPEQTICLRNGAQSIPASIGVAPRLLLTMADRSSRRRIVLGGYLLDRDGRAIRSCDLFAVYDSDGRRYAEAATLYNGRWLLELHRSASGAPFRIALAIGVPGHDYWISMTVPQRGFRL